jgi:hypothetical protein
MSAIVPQPDTITDHAADVQAYFTQQANDFLATYASAPDDSRRPALAASAPLIEQAAQGADCLAGRATDGPCRESDARFGQFFASYFTTAKDLSR